jgi:hypothetical protein
MGKIAMSDIVKAMEHVYTAVSKHHPELNELHTVMFTVYIDQRGAKRGHYWYNAWHEKTEEGQVQQDRDEVYINSDILVEGAESVMRTILHEACHGLARARGIKDTSSGGRYHNKRFKAIAEEVGLSVQKSKHGWSTPGLSDAAKARYANEMAVLEGVLKYYQFRTPKKSRNCRLVKAVCDCGRIIRLSRKVFEEGDIVCDLCGSRFEA